jgi:type IV secretory pathway VirB10-like protein
MPDLLHPCTGLRFRKTLAAALWLAGVVATSSCVFHKAPRAFNPPPVSAKAPEPIPPAADIALPPEVAFEPVLYDFPRQPDPSSGFPELPAPRAPRAPVATVPRPAPSENPPVAAPKLAQILTPEESRRNTQELEQYTERVKRALAMVAEKNLTAEQKDIAERVRTYLLQAEQAREQDLVTAVNLARRADLLAKDLLERLP